MRRRDEATYLLHLTAKITFGAALGGHAYARRRVRAVKDRWLP